MNVKVLPLVIGWLLVATSFGLCTDPSVNVEWRNGDVLSAELIALEQNKIRVRSRLFLTPIDIDRSEIRSIRFVQPWKSELEPGTVTLGMTDGSTLRGSIVLDNKDAPTIDFIDDAIGKLRIPRKSILQSSSSRTALYEWNGSVDPWGSIGSEKLTWKVDDRGFFSSDSPNQSAMLPIATNGSFAIEATLYTPARPDFVLSMGNDPEESIRIGTVGKTLIIGTSMDFEVIEDLSNKEWKYTFRLEWDHDKRELSLTNADGTKVVTKSTRAEKMEGVFLTNRGSAFKLEQLRLFNSLTDGRESLVDPTINAKAMLESKAADSNTQCMLRFANNTVLNGNILHFRDGLFTVENEAVQQETIHFTAQQLVKIDQPIAPANISKPHKLRLGSNSIQGECEFVGGTNPIRWKCLGQEIAVPVATDLPSTIQYDLNPKQRPSHSQFQDIVFASNGDNLPTKLIRMRDQQVELDLPFLSGVLVNSMHLQAVELAGKGKRLQHGFTKESRDQLLSFPRGTELSLYPHALIGKNEDLLRGMVMSVTSTAIEMDVRLEPCLIGRDAVNAIVFLPMASADSSQRAEKGAAKSSPDSKVDSVGIALANGYRISVDILKVEGDTLLCKSSWLGEFKLATQWISGISLGAASVGEPSSYVNWEAKMLRDPVWMDTPTDAQAQSLVGTVVENFSLSTLKGETWNSQDHVGKVVVLDFWATWCGPCVKSLPEYLAVANQYNANDVVFLGVNTTETPDVVREFVEKQKLDGFDTLFDFDGILTQRMQVSGIPHTIVIGPSSKIEYVHVGYSKNASKDLDAMIKKCLGR